MTDGCQSVRMPQLTHTDRVGFHAAEWGVTFLQPLDRPTVLVEGWRESKGVLGRPTRGAVPGAAAAPTTPRWARRRVLARETVAGGRAGGWVGKPRARRSAVVVGTGGCYP